MRAKLLLLLFISLILNCKQNPGTAKQEAEEIKEEPKTTSEVSPIAKELIQFADLTFTDSTDVNDLVLFKEIDGKGAVTETDMNSAVTLYEKMAKRGQITLYPIFEIKDTDTAILPIQGAGFGGAIWAKVLVDRNTLEIEKIAFGHKAESEGYGAAMTQTSFENQFVGTKINLEEDTFTLRQAMDKVRDDGQIIDGISGATMTSQGVVEMVNEGMKNYRNYLSP